MDPNRPTIGGGPPTEYYIPSQPRNIAPAPPRPAQSQPLPHSSPLYHSLYSNPPHAQIHSQSPQISPSPQDNAQQPFHVYYAPPPVPPPPRNDQPSPSADTNRAKLLPGQSYYQATPGGPFRITPSLAYPCTSQPNAGPVPNSPLQSPGNWYNSISQTVYGPSNGATSANVNWQQPYAQNSLGPVPLEPRGLAPANYDIQARKAQSFPGTQTPQPPLQENTLASIEQSGTDAKTSQKTKPKKARASKKAGSTEEGDTGRDATRKVPKAAKVPKTPKVPKPKVIKPKASKKGPAQASDRAMEFEAATILGRSQSRERLGENESDGGGSQVAGGTSGVQASFNVGRATSGLGENGLSISAGASHQTHSGVEAVAAATILASRQALEDSDSEEVDDDDDPGPVEGSTDDESDDGSSDGDEYDSIMSKLNKYKGGLVNALGGYSQKTSGFGIPDDESEPREEREATPKDPTRLRKVKHRGPHPAAEVTGEIKLRLGVANEAFAESRIDEAKALVDEIIRINAETYEAWNLLSSIFQEKNMVDDAFMALIVAAHLRPKYVEAWFNAADYALTSMGPLTPKILGDAQFCLASAIRQVPTSLDARRRKINVLLLRERYNLAARELAYLLRTIPHDLEVIRELAMVYVDLRDGMAGTELYRKTIAHYRKVPDDFDLSIDWNDLHSCAVLYSLMENTKDALKEMKALARWLLGREDETFWDDVVETDCEWDVDDSRRIKDVVKYKPGDHPQSSYGEGLPIELRTYFGKYRLNLKNYDEARRHFRFLIDQRDEAGEKIANSHTHLVADIAASYFAAAQYRDALVFFEALKDTSTQLTAATHFQMGKCYIYEDRGSEAEAAFRQACVVDEANIEARIELARLYERMDEAEQAFVYVNQILELESLKQPAMYRRRRENYNLANIDTSKSFLPGPARASRRNKAREEKELSKATLAEALRDQYFIFRKEADGMRAGKHRATDAWMDSARALTEDFRSCRAFYPWDRKEFDGYTAEEAKQAQTSLKLDLEALNQEHAESIGMNLPIDYSKVPDHYRGISFKDWIDIFCEYAICLAKRGRLREAYDICEAGIHAICFMFNKEDMFMLHLCYCVCALAGNDEETCVGMARWFMVRYQFTTDSYRMFAALLRICHSPISWYSSGPTQKFILRQIKTMDWALSNETRRHIIKADKASYTHLDSNGKIVVNEDLDVSLLMIYGHILVAGASYVYALNYFHRALSIDPTNPMIMLSLGLSYIQYALKRQVDNRQYVIMQGIAMMHQYYNIRLESPHFQERLEAHYNMARSYHLVGLTHLAMPYYRKVLKGAEEEGFEKGMVDDFCLDAAYNLQTIYTTAGNMELAQSVTRKWLVI